MDKVRKITDSLAIAGQPMHDSFQQLLEEGYRSVVNLRLPSEHGFLHDEQQRLECLGLRYVNLPVSLETLNLDQVLQTIQQIVALPKPMLMHCDSGVRSSIIVLMQIYIEQGITAEDAFQKVLSLGLLNDGSSVSSQTGGRHDKSNHKSNAPVNRCRH